jgi:uncharacterized protein (TIGR03067 family)
MLRIPVAFLFLVAGTSVADDAASKKFLKELEGSYSPLSMTRGVEAAPDDFLKTFVLTIKGDTLTVKFKKGDMVEDKAAIIVVDAAQKPTAIDMTPNEGKDAGKPVLGIVKIEKDVVTLCWADGDARSERPKEFSSTKENKHLVMVLKKK